MKGGSLRHHLVPFFSFGVWLTHKQWGVELRQLDLDSNSEFLLYPEIGPISLRTARYDVAGLLASKVQSWYVLQSLQSVKNTKFPNEDQQAYVNRVGFTNEVKQTKDIFALDADKKAMLFSYYKQTLIDYYDTDKTLGLPFYFMIGPYVEGVALSEWLGRDRRNFVYICGVFRFIVALLHRLKKTCGFEHRDLSTANIMMCEIAKTYTKKQLPRGVLQPAEMIFWMPNPKEFPVFIDFASARVSAQTMQAYTTDLPHSEFVSDGSTFSHDTRRLALHVAYAALRSLERSVDADRSEFNVYHTVSHIPPRVYDFCMCMLQFDIAQADCNFKQFNEFRHAARRVQSLFLLFYKIVGSATSEVVLERLMQPVQLASGFLQAVRNAMTLLEQVLLHQLKGVLVNLLPGSTSFNYEASTYSCDALKAWPLLFPPN
jgi:serine/threonine protein kinase